MKYNFIILLFFIHMSGSFGQMNGCNSIEECFVESVFQGGDIKVQISINNYIELYSAQMPSLYIPQNQCYPSIGVILPKGIYDELMWFDINDNILESVLPNVNHYSGNSMGHLRYIDKGIERIVIASNSRSIDDLEFKLLSYDIMGNLEWVSDRKFVIDDYNLSPSRRQIAPNLSLYDINKDGILEIITYNRVFNSDNGIMLCEGGDNGRGGRNSSIIVGELNGDDSSLEIAAGNTVYDVELNNLDGEVGNIMTPHILDDIFIRDGLTSMADINHDGISDIIVMPQYDAAARPYLYAYTFVGGSISLLASIKLPLVSEEITLSQTTGRPAYGKVGPDQTEGILVTTTDSLRFITYDGSQVLKQEWAFYVENRYGALTPTLFDINGDGENEIIIGGVNKLYILNVIDNKPIAIYEADCPTRDFSQVPIVADIDNDGEAEICTICEDEEGNGRLTIFSSPEDGPPWAPARGIWNQYGYHVLNINDDMTVPQYMENNATYMDGKYNYFMVQESLLGEDGTVQYPAASMYGEMDCIDYDEMTGGGSIDFYIYNKEDASRSASDSVIVSFYNGDPYNGGVLLDTLEIRGGIPPGGVKTGTYILDNITGIDRVYLLVNAMSVSTSSPLAEDFIDRECDVTDNVYMMELGFETVEEERELCEGDSYDFYGEEITTAGIYFHREEDMMGCLTTLYKLEVDVVDEITTTLSTEACESYTINNETITTSGVYEYSYESNNGCDSIVTLDLTINEPSSTIVEVTECASYQWNGTTYTESGTYEYASFNQYGCDSIATLELEINENIEQSLTVGACDSYDWNGTSYTESGTYTYEGVTSAGCDSIVTLDLTISEEIELTESVVTCERYEIDGDILTESGNYTYDYTSTSGCDSIVTLDLTIHEPSSSQIVVSECESYQWNGATYTESGTYEYESLNQYGCDSIATLELEINNNIEQSLTVGACDTYDWNGATYTESGMYTYEGLTNAGCDSIVTLVLTISDVIELTESVVTCERYEIDGDILIESGSYIYNYTSVSGCDSIVTLDLTIHELSSTTVEVTECESYTWNGVTYTESGIYEYQSLNQYGCDSIATLELEINKNIEQSLTVGACDSYDWNGATYTESGTYTYEGLTSAGCDSIVTLDLTITDVIEIEETAMACDSYQWDGETYEESGIYRVESISADGCDSVTTLELLIFPSYLMQDTVETTEPYHWVINGATYDESGVYREDLVSSAGCDSIYVLMLRIEKDRVIDYPNVLKVGTGRFNLYGSAQIEKIEELRVYDRWGNQIVYMNNIEANDPTQGWDGTKKGKRLTPGVYVWKASIRMRDGSLRVKAGDVTLLE